MATKVLLVGTGATEALTHLGTRTECSIGADVTMYKGGNHVYTVWSLETPDVNSTLFQSYCVGTNYCILFGDQTELAVDVQKWCPQAHFLKFIDMDVLRYHLYSKFTHCHSPHHIDHYLPELSQTLASSLCA